MSKSIFVLINIVLLPLAIAVSCLGLFKMLDSNYNNFDLSAGYVFSLCWLCIGGAILFQWFVWIVSHFAYEKRFKVEHLMFNGAFVLTSLTFIITGIVSIENNPLSLGICQCKDLYYGIDCIPCNCQNGVCDDGVHGTGTCVCDQGYTGLSCNQCAPHYKKVNNRCVCERVWTGSDCSIPVVGYNNTNYPSITCSKGWDQTGATSTSHGIWPVCGACSKGYAGEPSVNCKPCLKNCNGLGECWDNENFEKNVFNKEICTASWSNCVKDSDCPSFNCGGKCRSRFKESSVSWFNTFDGKTCHKNSDCNFEPNIFINQTLPAGWDSEGECTEKSCCKEPKYGNATCYNCKNGRVSPACDECPAFDCNGKGTCLPYYKDDEYEKLICKCQTEGNTVWKGEFCECLAESPFSDTCSTCVQGYYLPADVNESIRENIPLPAKTFCQQCPGVVKGQGIGACNWEKGLGTCINIDSVSIDNLLNVGKCSCTTALMQYPPLAATGETCNDAPPNFYKLYSGKDWVMTACPRTLPLGECSNPWEYYRPDGKLESACTQSCGAKTATCNNGTCICGNNYNKGINGLCY